MLIRTAIIEDNEIISEGRPIDSMLTRREKEILNGIAAGKTNEDIAEMLSISRHTVRTHIKNIYEKLHVHSKVAAVIKANEEGFNYNRLTR
ncbi:helix-turn-helix transcriptional regulator [Candidatus Micrarchaeota archaeon]|nr:helix-turn-helix transcriptional regulator [Candidatus Micrarchaeota archaeon]